MTLHELEQEALALDQPDRVALVLKVLDTLPLDTADVSDEEALRRDEELEQGTVTPLAHDEFVRRVRQARGR